MKIIKNIIAGIVTFILLPIQISWVILCIFLEIILMIILGIICIIFWGFSFEKGINYINNIINPYINYLDIQDNNDIFWIIKVRELIKGD